MQTYNAYFVALAPMSVGGISQPAKQTFCPVQSNILLSAHFKYGQHTCTPSLNGSSQVLRQVSQLAFFGT